jgi:peptidoglycan/LPS O-acetylase OafA/YrhL
LGEPWMVSKFGGHPTALAVYAYSLTIGLVSFCAAFLSYHLLEKHFLALKHLFVARTATATQGSVSTP